MLMITQESVWCTYWKVDPKLSKHLSMNTYGLDMKHNPILALFILLIEDSVL